jgi:hypothetical protein
VTRKGDSVMMFEMKEIGLTDLTVQVNANLIG